MQRKLSAPVLTFLLFVMVTSTAVPNAVAADEPPAAAGKVTLKEGTEVKLKFADDLSFRKRPAREIR